MLCLFKQWSQRLFERRQRSDDKRGRPESSMPVNTASKDPRELPRPSKQKSAAEPTNRSYANKACDDKEDVNNAGCEGKFQRINNGPSTCRCWNCTVLSTFTECGICFDPLQGLDIESCTICGNLVCAACSSRLNSCAFCRSKVSVQRNRALERLLEKLMLPCRNSRYGCVVIGDGSQRVLHELICSYAEVSCPVGRISCGWQGAARDARKHFKEAHELLPISNHMVSINITNFREKALARQGHQYTACLACYDQLFVVKLILFRGTLKFSFSSLGHIREVSDVCSSLLYGVSVIVGNADKHVQTISLFKKRGNNICDMQIEAGRFYHRKETENVTDVVSVEIDVKPVDFA